MVDRTSQKAARSRKSCAVLLILQMCHKPGDHHSEYMVDADIVKMRTYVIVFIFPGAQSSQIKHETPTLVTRLPSRTTEGKTKKRAVSSTATCREPTFKRKPETKHVRTSASWQCRTLRALPPLVSFVLIFVYHSPR